MWNKCYLTGTDEQKKNRIKYQNENYYYWNISTHSVYINSFKVKLFSRATLTVLISENKCIHLHVYNTDCSYLHVYTAEPNFSMPVTTSLDITMCVLTSPCSIT